MDSLLLITLCILSAYVAGRADILRRIWKRVSGRERVRLTLKKIIHEGEAVPRFYGFGYIDWPRLEKTAYPVPLNLFVRYGRALWYWLEYLLRARRATWIDRKLGEAYHKGMDAGRESYQAGYEKGKQDGFEEGRRMLFDAFWKELDKQETGAEPEVTHITITNALTEANDDNPPA